MEKLELFSKFYEHQFSFESFGEEGEGADRREQQVSYLQD